MLKLFKQLFSNSNSDSELSQTEREAIIDLMLLAIYADNHISLDENQVLEDRIDGLGWDSGTSISMYLNTATTNARDALTDETSRNEFLDGVATRLSSAASKEKALGLLKQLFDADGTDLAEESFYKNIKEKLA